MKKGTIRYHIIIYVYHGKLGFRLRFETNPAHVMKNSRRSFQKLKRYESRLKFINTPPCFISNVMTIIRSTWFVKINKSYLILSNFLLLALYSYVYINYNTLKALISYELTTVVKHLTDFLRILSITSAFEL